MTRRATQRRRRSGASRARGEALFLSFFFCFEEAEVEKRDDASARREQKHLIDGSGFALAFSLLLFFFTDDAPLEESEKAIMTKISAGGGTKERARASSLRESERGKEVWTRVFFFRSCFLRSLLLLCLFFPSSLFLFLFLLRKERHQRGSFLFSFPFSPHPSPAYLFAMADGAGPSNPAPPTDE